MLFFYSVFSRGKAETVNLRWSEFLGGVAARAVSAIIEQIEGDNVIVYF